MQAQQETSRQAVPNVTLEETNRERNIFRPCFSTTGISETLFQLFVQGRQLVLHLPDFVLREGLLPTNIYEYLIIFGNFLCISNFGIRFQDKSEKVGKERQLKPGTEASKWSTFFGCINGDNRSRDKTRVYRNEI